MTALCYAGGVRMVARPGSEPQLIGLIEDEQTLANTIQLKLKEAGYAVAVARNGPAGLALIEHRRPRLVLLDMLLPGEGGMAILEELRVRGVLPALPVIIISNSGQPVEIARARELGVRDYLVKVDLTPDEVVAAVREVLAEDRRTATGQAAEQTGPRLLVIEDDQLLCSQLVDHFTERGYRVFTAATVSEARLALTREQIDLILLDVRLPGEDGFSFLRELKAAARWRAVPVVIISNLGQREEVERGLAAGAADYLVKADVLPEEIERRVAAVLRQAG